MKFENSEVNSDEQHHDFSKDDGSFVDEVLPSDKSMKLEVMKHIIEQEFIRSDAANRIISFEQNIDGETFTRNVEIQMLKEENVMFVLHWVKDYVTSEKCTEFGATKAKMKEKKYWQNIYEKKICFVIFVDGIVVGICSWQGVASADEDKIPSGYIVKKRKKVAYRNLADLSWLKACAKEKEPNLKGVMKHAVSYIVSMISNESSRQINGNERKNEYSYH